MALKPGDGLDTWELSTAKKLVAEFRRKSRELKRFDYDDLVQDCLLHWVVIRSKLDLDRHRPPVGFMSQVLRNMLNDCIRKQNADRRVGDQTVTSLDASIDESEDGPTLAEALAMTEHEWSCDRCETARHMRMDLLRVLPRLTSKQQRLCLLLGEEGLSVRQAAEQLRIPRGTLYREIKQIRELFGSKGLDVYLRD